MTAEADVESEEPAKKSKLPLLLGVVLAIAGGGGGFFAVSSGMLLGADPEEAGHEEEHAEDAESAEPVETFAFVPLDPLVISMPSDRGQSLLRFRAELEVQPEYQEEIAGIAPRIIDVLNGYLRAVSLAELEDPTVLVRLRGQMLRRIQVVTGPDKVRDLLIMEFVVN